MDDFGASAGGEYFFEFVAGFAEGLADFATAEFGLAAGDEGVVGDDVEGVAGVVIAGGGGDADGEEAGVFFAEGAGGVGVDCQGAGGFLKVGDPAFFGFEGESVGNEEGAGVVAGEEAGDDVGFGSAGDEDAAAGFGGEFGGGDFGDHAAGGGDVGGVAGEGFDGGGDFFDDGDDFAGAFHVDEAGGGGEDDEVLGAHEGGEEGGEGVVVAEFDFGGGDGVVFIDDGDGAVGEDGFEGGFDAEVAVTVAEVFAGKENLGGGDAVGVESALPVLHEERLADGGAGLFLGDFAGFAFEIETAHAEADGGRGDDDDAVAVFAEGGDLGAEGGDAGSVEFADAGGEDAGAEFDDDGLFAGFHFFTTEARRTGEFTIYDI